MVKKRKQIKEKKLIDEAAERLAEIFIAQVEYNHRNKKQDKKKKR